MLYKNDAIKNCIDIITESLWNLGECDLYKSRPVDINTFIEDDYYLGKIYGRGHLFPYWKKLLNKVYPNPFYSPYEEVILSCAIGAGKCVHKDTYISSSAGIKTIGDMYESGDVNALIRTEDGIFPITAIIKNGTKDLKVLKTAKGKILKATPEHRFRVLDSDLKVQWKYVRDIRVGDKLISAEIEQEHGVLELPEDYAYFLGVLTGSGSMGTDHVAFNFDEQSSTDLDFVNLIQELMTRFSQNENFLEVVKGRKSTVSAIFSECTELRFGLLESGWNNNKVATAVFKSCGKDLWSFLSGIVDSMGIVNPNGSVDIESPYESLIRDLSTISSALGLRHSISTGIPKGGKFTIYSLKYSGLETVQAMAENIHSKISYKQKRLETITSYQNRTGFITPFPVNLESEQALCDKYPKIFGTKAKGRIDISRRDLWKVQNEYEELDSDLKYLLDLHASLDSVLAIDSEVADTFDLSIENHPSYMIDGFVSHNSSVTSVSIAYEIYRLLMLKDPNKYYNLLDVDTIVFMLFAATQGTAQDVNWGYISNILAVSPFFIDNLDFKETKAQFIELTPHIGIQIGSRAHKALGKAVLSAVLDEGNFGLIQDQVKNTYNAIMRRRGSRFKQGFKTPGIVWLVSSPQTGEDFINERIKKAEGNDKILVVDNVPIWEVKAEKVQYCGETFPVFLGDEVQDPQILESDEVSKNFPADLIINVPVEYRTDFESDLLDAIRDIAGRRIASSLNVFKSYSQLVKTFRKSNLFKTDTMPVHLGTQIHDFQEYINIPLLQQLIQDPTPRCIHLDSALTGDRYGIASCLCTSRDMYDAMTDSVISRRLFVNDFSVGLEAINSDGMPASAIAKFLIWLKSQGYPIALITGDKPATTSIIPELKIAKFKTEYLSVDTDRSPYLVLKQRILSGEFIGTNNKILIKELYNVRDDGLKVDHPVKFPDGCFGGSSSLYYNGSSITFEELASKGRSHEFYTIGCTENGELKEVLAYNAHKTKTVDEFYEIEFEDGSIIEVTPEHLFLLEDGTYKMAKDLTDKDEIRTAKWA